MEATFNPSSALAGGALIGLAAVLLLIATGRIAGVSGILGAVLQRPDSDAPWRIAFVVGLCIGAASYALAQPGRYVVQIDAGWATLLLGGLLVGFGSSMGSGCTSGHGICGIARFSKRSIVATVTFMSAAAATVFVVRHLL
jgi:uncharacterized membrane protein YedE/YeeE